MLVLPPHINAHGLVPFLKLLAEHADDPEVVIDFASLKRVSPAGLAALTAFCAKRTKSKLQTTAHSLDSCLISNYLRRMNLHRLCGWDSGREPFTRHDAKERFVPLEEITAHVDDLGHRIAGCIAPGGEDFEHPNAGAYDAAYYLITEIANNVRQHSRGAGYIAAQTTRNDGFVRIAIADSGWGIPGSLKDAGIQWAQELPDEDIIEQAMVAGVSSKGQPSNEGVGLTLSSRTVELMSGHMLISSGAGLLKRIHNSKPEKESFSSGKRFPGTLVAMTFLLSESSDFELKLQKAKELDLHLRRRIQPATFAP